MSPPPPLNTNNNTEIGTPEFPEFRRWQCSVDGVVTDVLKNSSMYRLRWTLNGPLTTAICVMTDSKDRSISGGSEPYYQPTTTNLNTDNTTTTTNSDSESESQWHWHWHPISKESLTNPPISSVRVEVQPLEQWEYNWLELHSGHSLPPRNDVNSCGDPASDVTAEYGPLPDHDEHENLNPEDDENDDWPECSGPGTGHLISCCGTKRPRKTVRKGRLLVSVSARARATGTGGSKTARSGTGPGYLTVHDYIEQIHPWLMSMRGDILGAKAVMKGLLCEWEGPEEELLEKWGRDDMLFFVDINTAPEGVAIIDAEEWVDTYLPNYPMYLPHRSRIG